MAEPLIRTGNNRVLVSATYPRRFVSALASRSSEIAVLALCTVIVVPAVAQDDVTTQHASSGYGGAWITGPASNPLSFLNGPAYRTFGQTTPYDAPDFAPARLLDEQLPRWISFGLEERFRYEGYHNSGFRLNSNDSYILLRSRLFTIKPTRWLKIVTQVQDARPFMQKPPWGPPNLSAWDLKLAYLQLGDPEKQWISVRVGRQLINYNNTIIADSEWRNQGALLRCGGCEPALQPLSPGSLCGFGCRSDGRGYQPS